MLGWMRNFIDNYTHGMYFPKIQIMDIIEILIITVIVYEIMLWIKNTKAWMLLRGGVFDLIGTILIWAAVALTVISLIDYVWKNRQVLTQGGM